MDNFDLSRLNPLAFERLIRALSFAEMGPAGTVYSSGPDGGRDFTYEGDIPGYEGKSWNGYLVLQAKFKDPSASTVDDMSWLRTQLQKELTKYTQPGSRLRRPDYYILVTNLRLSGSDGRANKRTGKKRTGSHSKAADLLNSWKLALSLKDFDLWGHDKIVDLLVAYPSIRQSYAQWTTSGDVLTKALEQFKAVRPEFGEVASRSLKVSLQRDQYVRLKDAGSVGDLQIRTSQVIVDLPLVRPRWHHDRRWLADAPFTNEETDRTPTNAIAKLVDRAREKLDADTLLGDEDRSENQERPQVRNRIVLIGGPGQGKSTASLFLTQIFRAAILQNQPSTRRDHGVKLLIPEILKRATKENISTSVPPRYPLHISLPRFADVISNARQSTGKLPSLLSHIAAEMAACADQDVERSDLRNWLRHYPWLLVLDGLDEVPPTGERPSILEAISTFFTEVSEVNADILVVVTTRPQGYNKDLDEKLWEHWQLADLDAKQALSYAKAFGEARYPDDLHRREDVHQSLVKASMQPATARLMVSPLQVTILHFIVDTGGGVPTARWTLFNEYFEVLKRREKAKGGELQKFLERHWGHLGPIHHRAGLVLQTDSEHAGGAGSRFSQDRFRRLISTYLASEGFVGDDLNQRVDELMKLALNRLVLLSQQVEGTISFDVRSLQEFMAAAAITSGDERIMEARLAHIAGHSHWRHVFQIAASRCFADDGFLYRRSTIPAIARQIDVTEPDMLVKNGARLALDLVADGIALDHPNFRRPLVQHALEQIDLGSAILDDKLATIWDSTTSDIAETQIAQRIVEGSSAPAMCAWRLLFLISQLGCSWADDLIVKLWPPDQKLRLKIIEQVRAPFGSQRISDLIADTFSEVGPILGVRYFSLAHSLETRDTGGGDKVDLSRLRSMNFSRFYVGETAGYQSCALLPDQYQNAYAVRFVSVDSLAVYERFSGQDFVPSAWAGITAIRGFAGSPSASTFAAAVRALAANGCDKNLVRYLPWPVAGVFLEASSRDHLEQIAAEIERGRGGQPEDWRAAESRWKSSGISERDIHAFNKTRWLDPNIREVGAPVWIESYHGAERHGAALARKLVEISKEIKSSEIAQMLVSSATAIAAFSRVKLNVADAKSMLEILSNSPIRFPMEEFLKSAPPELWVDRAAAENLARTLAFPQYFGSNPGLFRIALWEAFSREPKCTALIFPLTCAIVADESQAKEDVPKLLVEIGHLDPGADRDVALAIGILRMVDGGAADVGAAVQLVLSFPENLIGLLEKVLGGDLIPVDQRLLLLSALISKGREEVSGNWRRMIAPTRRALDSRKSGFGKVEVWKDKLGLPPESYSVLLPMAVTLTSAA
jgi:hypothetical protein